MKTLTCLLLLCVSCASPTMPKQKPLSLDGGGGGSCPYDGQLNSVSISIHYDQFSGIVNYPAYETALFWSDSAAVILNQIKHAESTLTCVPERSLAIFTDMTSAVGTPPEQVPTGVIMSIDISFGGDYAPTAGERDSLVHICNNAIYWMNIHVGDIYAREQSHNNLGLNEFNWSYSGGF